MEAGGVPAPKMTSFTTWKMYGDSSGADMVCVYYVVGVVVEW